MSFCFRDFVNATKGILSEDDAENVLKELRGRAQEKRFLKASTKADALNKSIDDVLKEMDFKEKQSRINSRKNVIRRQAAKDQISQFEGKGGLAVGWNAFWNGVEGNVKMGRFSFSSRYGSNRIMALSNLYIDLLNDFPKGEGVQYFKNIKNGFKIAQELEKEGSSEDPMAKSVAKAIKKNRDNWSKLLRNEGAFIPETEGYIARLSHNASEMLSPTGSRLKDWRLKTKLNVQFKGDTVKVNSAIRDAAFERWSNNISSKLDEAKTFESVNPGDEEKFLRSAYDAITTGVRRDAYFSNGNQILTNLRKKYNVVDRMTASRKLFFKQDGSSWYDYNKDYGHKNVHDAVISQLEQISRDYTNLSVLGSNPQSMFDSLERWVKQKDRTNPFLKKSLRRARGTFNTAMGDYSRPFDSLGGKILNSLRISQYMSKLGGITASSVPDLGIMASALSQHDIPFMKVYQTAFSNLASGMPKDDLKQLALRLGAFSDGRIGGLLQRFGYAEDSPPNMLNRAIDLQDKISGINYWDSVNRWTMGQLLSNNFAENLKNDFDDLPPKMQRVLNIEGIDKDRWELLQGLGDKVDTIDGKKYITPDHVAQIDGQKLVDKLAPGKKATPFRIKKLQQNFYERMYNYFHDQTLYGKVFPELSDRSFLNGMTKSDTFAGQAWRLLTQFKSFHVASTRRLFGRFIYGNGANSLFEAILQNKVDWGGMSNFMVQSLPWGYMSLAAKAMADGFQPPSLKDKDTWMQAGLSGGTFGIYGLLLSGNYQDEGGFLKGLAPGGVRTGFDIAKTIVDLGKKMSGASADPTKDMIWLLQDNLPLGRTIGLKHVLDHEFYDRLYRSNNPLYDIQMNERNQRNHKQPLWLK